ncbi:MAG: hypothetical protein OXD30_10050 [Bryobacterales bacterium]|nr:hypothetical protein [Bryobacterales bacterium]
MAEERPKFFKDPCPEKCLRHYEREYCKKEIYTSDQIRVHFKPNSFWHAFYEGNDFDSERAKRIDWIAPALASHESKQFFGWNKKIGADMLDRRVALYEGFVVVLQVKMGRRRSLKAEFVTCYPASRETQEKINTSRPWDRNKTVEALEHKKLELHRIESRRGKR